MDRNGPNFNFLLPSYAVVKFKTIVFIARYLHSAIFFFSRALLGSWSSIYNCSDMVIQLLFLILQSSYRAQNIKNVSPYSKIAIIFVKIFPSFSYSKVQMINSYPVMMFFIFKIRPAFNTT